MRGEVSKINRQKKIKTEQIAERITLYIRLYKTLKKFIFYNFFNLEEEFLCLKN